MRRFTRKLFVTSCLLLLPLLTTSCKPTVADKVKAFQKAANSHNVEKLLSFYADDVRFEIVGTPMVIEGKEKIRKPIEEQFILNVHMTFSDIEINGNTATYKVKEQNDMLKAAGIDALYYEHDQITLKDGLIIEERATPAQESMKIMAEFRQSFERWASEKRLEEWAKLKAEGVTEENVDKWLAMTRQWREATEKENQ